MTPGDLLSCRLPVCSPARPPGLPTPPPRSVATEYSFGRRRLLLEPSLASSRRAKNLGCSANRLACLPWTRHPGSCVRMRVLALFMACSARFLTPITLQEQQPWRTESSIAWISQRIVLRRLDGKTLLMHGLVESEREKERARESTPSLHCAVT